MRLLLAIAFCLPAGSALADLYRWIEPETGSIKFSSYPPPWYGDPEQERRAPKVERIPEAKASAASEAKVPQGSDLAALEARRSALLQDLSASPGRGDFDRAGAGFKRQIEAYLALSRELDRLDPQGADRRRAEGQSLIERILRGR